MLILPSLSLTRRMWFRFDIVWGAIDFPHLQESWLNCRIESQTWNKHWLSKRVIFYPSANSAQGYCHHLCLSVCSSVCPSTLWEAYVSIQLCTPHRLFIHLWFSHVKFWDLDWFFWKKKWHFSQFEKKFGLNEIWRMIWARPLELCPILNLYLILNIDCWYQL